MEISPFSATWRNDIIKALAGLEPLNDTLSAIAALTGEPDKGIYFTGEDSAALFTLTEFARTLLATTDASAALSTLGVSDFAQTLLDDADAGAALTTLGVSAFIQTLLDDADAEEARQTLGADDASNLTTGTLPNARVSSSLTADKAFRRGNILGTVSESGGVPTGALIESGSNANGDYVLFASGLAICSAVINVDLTATGNQIFPLPISFSDTPVPSWGHNDAKVGGDVGALQNAFIDTFSGNWRWRCDGTGTSTSSSISVGAIGRWF